MSVPQLRALNPDFSCSVPFKADLKVWGGVPYPRRCWRAHEPSKPTFWV